MAWGYHSFVSSVDEHLEGSHLAENQAGQTFGDEF